MIKSNPKKKQISKKDTIFTSRLRVIVNANSNQNKLREFDDVKKAYKVDISAPAQNNKANLEIIKFFSKLSGKKVRLISGKTSKLKTISFE